MDKSNEKLTIKVSVNTIAVNVILSIFKLLSGVLGHSAAMISDSVHSLSDVLSTVIVIAGVKLAAKKSDKDHPYGHERFECVAAILLAVSLAGVGLLIGWDGIRKIIEGNFRQTEDTNILVLPLIAAVVSIAVKEAMYWYTRAAAKKTDSGALMADAWHHRSDALSSVGSFAGILGAKLGFLILDSVASLIIAVFIVKVAYEIFMDAIGKMTDRACSDEQENEIRNKILENKAILGIDLLNTRLFGNKIYIDLEIKMDGGILLS
ncbi:MAG: cation diffusion facilitator family transporter, partial [Oscillospiraceae bacterium]|nr:cation diffusion facilitator family transporter [Oscillospiraceae bacterium]